MNGRRGGWLWLTLFLGLSGCKVVGDNFLHNIILPEQRTIDHRDPGQFPAAALPPIPEPRTVSNPQPDLAEFRLSLDQAIRIALENARVIRILAGVAAVSSGQTIYDTAIVNTTIDQVQAAFDPVFRQNNEWSSTDTPTAILDAAHPLASILVGNTVERYRSDLTLNKRNLLGGEWSFGWVENPSRIEPGPLGSLFALNPQNRPSVELGYRQPFLRDAGYAVNTAPIVIARLDTERSYFQYKDSVQELVRGVIEAYWNLVLARTDAWARKIQLEQAEEANKREQARQEAGFADQRNVAQAKVTYNQFRASLIAAEAAVLTREGALRNILGLPPEDHRRIVPDSRPNQVRLPLNWHELTRLAEQRRPDIIELKLILEADQVRMIQAENAVLPRLDASALYRWNGLQGVMPNGEYLTNNPGQFADWTLGINFSVPLFLREGRARVRQQALIIARDRVNVEQAIHAALHEVAITLRDLDSDYEQYRAYQETRAAALENLQVQISDFNARGGIYLNVLQALNDWGNSVILEAQRLVQYNINLARLERQTGTILETHGLVFFEERVRSAGPLGILGHGREYPAALPPGGSTPRYPSSGEPGENSFDLAKPKIANVPLAPERGEPRLPPPTPLPEPRLPTPRSETPRPPADRPTPVDLPRFGL